MIEEHESGNPSLVVVSNRGPVEHHLGPGEEIQIKRASGGLATALSALREHHRFRWIASAITDGDRYIAGQCTKSGQHLSKKEKQSGEHAARKAGAGDDLVDLVCMPKDVFHAYYEIFSNRFLWFLQHSMWHLLQGQTAKRMIGEAWWGGYVPANAAFARAIAQRLRRQRKPAVMLQDYHLYLTPDLVRWQFPKAVLQHFVHIPWPEPTTWEAFPGALRRAILRGLLANDIIGFQTATSAQNFIHCCESFLDGVRVDFDGRVFLANRVTHIRVYPISVDVSALQALSHSLAFRQHQARLRQLCGEQTIVRVDRLDPSKNVARGFHAFQRLLEERPDLCGKLKFLAFLVPSRTTIPEYQACFQQVMGQVEAINARFGRAGYKPVELFYENDCQQALAGMSLADVLLVNAQADGMNLVAKEGMVVSARDSVLVLSKTAGAFEQLWTEAIGIDPLDVDGTKKALADALAMPGEERRKRSQRLRARIQSEDLAGWIKTQVDDIDEIIAERSHRSGRRALDSMSSVLQSPRKVL